MGRASLEYSNPFQLTGSKLISARRIGEISQEVASLVLGLLDLLRLPILKGPFARCTRRAIRALVVRGSAREGETALYLFVNCVCRFGENAAIRSGPQFDIDPKCATPDRGLRRHGTWDLARQPGSRNTCLETLEAHLG